MAEPSQRMPMTLWVGFALLLCLLGLAYLLSVAQYDKTKRMPLPVIDRITNFTLTNQDNHVVTLADLTNHVWVADIVFTRCAGSCPVMSTHMRSLQQALPADSEAKLVTLTTDPDYDSPEILKKYGQRYGADFHRWMFLTGAKTELARLAAGSLKLGSTPVPVQDQKSSDDLFVHSTMFVVVDRQLRLRSVFETEGENVEWTNVQPRIVAAVHQLEREQ